MRAGPPSSAFIINPRSAVSGWALNLNQPSECMANVGVGFSQDWWPRARIGGFEIARLAVMGVLGDVPGHPLLFHGYPRVPMKKPDGPELACHRAELIPSSNEIGKWGARFARPPFGVPISLHCLMVSAQLYGMPAQVHLAFHGSHTSHNHLAFHGHPTSHGLKE